MKISIVTGQFHRGLRALRQRISDRFEDHFEPRRRIIRHRQANNVGPKTKQHGDVHDKPTSLIPPSERSL